MASMRRRTTLYVQHLPQSEAPHAQAVFDNLLALDREVESLEAAVALHQWAFTAARSPENASLKFMILRWSTIGAKSGAISIYTFYQVWDGLGKSLSQAPYLHTRIEKANLRKARKLFDASFPNFADIRHVAAHGSEFYNTAEKMSSNSFSGEFNSGGIRSAADAGAKLVFLDVINNGDYCCTYDGKVLSYRPDIETVEKLREVCETIWGVFEPVFQSIKEDYINEFRRSQIAARPEEGAGTE